MAMLDLVLFGTLFVTTFLYLFYPLTLFAFSSFIYRNKQTSKEEDDLPKISVIVPTYNEVTTIRRKLESLLLAPYPKEKYEIMVVDSNSTDNTCRIVKEYETKGVILLRQEKRMGKASAINFALQATSGEIIVLTDANAQFHPKILKKLVQNFDEKTGAVLPRLVPCGRLGSWDKLFYNFHHMYKTLESNTDSVFIVFGELFAFRKELINKVDENAAADDLEMAITIRKKNYKIKYAPDLKVKEKIPDSQKEVRIQKTRRIFGIIQALVKNSSLFMNPKYKLYGLLIFPTHFLQMTAGPFLIFSSLALLVAKFLGVISEIFNPLLMASTLFFSFILLLVLYFLLDRIKVIISIGYNFLATQVYIIIALVDFLRGKKRHIWEKIPSTRMTVEN